MLFRSQTGKNSLWQMLLMALLLLGRRYRAETSR